MTTSNPPTSREALLDYFAAHAPVRPPAYEAWPVPPLPHDSTPEALEEQKVKVRHWRIEMDVAWRWHFALEMLRARATAQDMMVKLTREDAADD
jgi:hypothetical protein